MKDGLGENTDVFLTTVGTGTMTAKKNPTEQNLHRNLLSFIIKIFFFFLPPANMNILSLRKADSTERVAVNLSSNRYSHEACFLLSKSLKTQARMVIETLLLANTKTQQKIYGIKPCLAISGFLGIWARLQSLISFAARDDPQIWSFAL